MEQRLKINDEVFEEMRLSADAVLQRLIRDMIEKGSEDGKVTISIGVNLAQQFRANYVDNPDASEDKYIYIPKIKYKVDSVMQIKNSIDGTQDYDGMEMAYDGGLSEYVIKPITGMEQMSIFDAEFKECYDIEPTKAIEEMPFGDSAVTDYDYDELPEE